LKNILLILYMVMFSILFEHYLIFYLRSIKFYDNYSSTMLIVFDKYQMIFKLYKLKTQSIYKFKNILYFKIFYIYLFEISCQYYQDN
jgi:hypothetical protein